MNTQRRKQIEKLNEEVSSLRDQLFSVKEDEECYYENMPDSFRNGEKGDKSQAAIDALDSAMQNLEEVTSYLDEAVSA